MRFLTVVGVLGMIAPLGARATTYSDFNSPYSGATVITGVRGASATVGDVVLTGSSLLSGGNTQPIIYQGSLAGDTLGTWTLLNPTFSGTTTSTLYGPNTGYYDTSLGNGGIRAVGSYKYTGGGSGDHGMMYTKVVAPGGGVTETWTNIDVPEATAGAPVLNTIAHSTMGNLVVGNYDTGLKTGNAFIYNITDNSFINMVPVAGISVTAYGIWMNPNGIYTITGGYSDITNGILDAGYVVDYDPTKTVVQDRYSNFTAYQYDNDNPDAVISHFDGITGTADGYTLTGDHATSELEPQGGFFASITRNEDGTFDPTADWASINVPLSLATSGNTIYQDTVLGVYVGPDGALSYTAVVPEPSSVALLAFGGLAALGMAVRSRRMGQLAR